MNPCAFKRNLKSIFQSPLDSPIEKEFDSDENTQYLGDIDKLLKRSKRDKLDALVTNENQHGNSINSHGHSLANLLNNFASKSRTSRKKQLVCFTQDYEDDLEKNLAKAIKFNDLINESAKWVVRNNRNTDSLNRRITAANEVNNINDILAISKKDIARFAKDLNKKFTFETTVSVPPTTLIPPYLEAHSNVPNFQTLNLPSKVTNSNRIRNNGFNGNFDNSNAIDRKFTINEQSESENLIVSSNGVSKQNSKSKSFDENSVKIERNGFRPIFNDNVKSSTANLKRINSLSSLNQYRRQQNQRLRELRNQHNKEKKIRPNNVKDQRDQNARHQNTNLVTANRRSITTTIAEDLDSLIDNPGNSDHLKNVLFPNSNVQLHVRKGKKLFQKTLQTRRNDNVRIQSYKQ